MFLSGFYWHLSGPSELPLEQHLPLRAGKPFPPFSLIFRESAFIFQAFFFGVGLYLILKYVRARCRRASAANTAQLGQQCIKQQSNTCRPELDNASKQTTVESYHVEHFLIQLAAFSKRTKQSKYSRKIYNSQRRSSWCDTRRTCHYQVFIIPNLKKIQHCSFSPSFPCISYKPVLAVVLISSHLCRYVITESSGTRSSSYNSSSV